MGCFHFMPSSQARRIQSFSMSVAQGSTLNASRVTSTEQTPHMELKYDFTLLISVHHQTKSVDLS